MKVSHNVLLESRSDFLVLW